MTAAQLLNIWRAECTVAPGYLAVSPAGIGFNEKGLKLNDAALMRIGAAIEALAEPTLPAAATITLEARGVEPLESVLWLDLPHPLDPERRHA